MRGDPRTIAALPPEVRPETLIERQPYLPRFMAGGEGNPLGARALYLGDTLYRIHGTNQPSTIAPRNDELQVCPRLSQFS